MWWWNWENFWVKKSPLYAVVSYSVFDGLLSVPPATPLASLLPRGKLSLKLLGQCETLLFDASKN